MKKHGRNFSLLRFLVYLFLILSSIVMIFPFIWMISTSLKAPTEAISIPPKLLPEQKWFIKGTSTQVTIIKRENGTARIRILAGQDQGKELRLPGSSVVRRVFMWSNYVEAWRSAPFGMYFFNSIITTVIITTAQILTSALAAYAFARLRFPLKNFLFMVLVATLMIPSQVILVPNYVLLAKLKWINTYWALTIPFLASVFGIYFMRQHFESIPKDLFDAAKIDGCSHLQTLTKVALPLSTSVIVSTGLFTFIGNWNALLWPLIVTNSPMMRTLQVGLSVFNQEAGSNWNLLMAASTFSLLPLILVFFMAQKTFIEGVAGSGLKE
jgi:multiple sugar transport system permease protein